MFLLAVPPISVPVPVRPGVRRRVPVLRAVLPRRVPVPDGVFAVPRGGKTFFESSPRFEMPRVARSRGVRPRSSLPPFKFDLRRVVVPTFDCEPVPPPVRPFRVAIAVTPLIESTRAFTNGSTSRLLRTANEKPEDAHPLVHDKQLSMRGLARGIALRPRGAPTECPPVRVLPTLRDGYCDSPCIQGSPGDIVPRVCPSPA